MRPLGAGETPRTPTGFGPLGLTHLPQQTGGGPVGVGCRNTGPSRSRGVAPGGGVDAPDHPGPPPQPSPSGFEVRIADTGRITHRGRRYRVPKTFNGRPLSIAPTNTGDIHEIWYRHQAITTITITHDL